MACLVCAHFSTRRCVARQEQLLTPAAPATILTMKAPQIILELSAAEGLS
jgi:hypothetical protein